MVGGQLALAIILVCPGVTRAQDVNPSNRHAGPIPVAVLKRTSPVDFNREILPVLRNNCLACHNRTTAKASLVLETPADMVRGGDSGPALEPGKGSSSLLLRAAAHEPEDIRMPPPGNKARASDLTPEELALLKLWIDQGATAQGPTRAEPEWRPLPKTLNPVYAVALTRDGQFAACGRANQIHVYHLPTRRLIARLADFSSPPGSAHRDLVQSLDFNPAGTLLASGAYREIKIWQRPINPSKFQVELPPGNRITCLAASPDGKWFATGAADGRIQLRSTSAGKLERLLARHRGAVTGLAFSPDGSLIGSGSTDSSLRIWSVADGRLLTSVRTPAEITAVTWLASDDRLASGGADHRIRIWKLDRIRPDLRENSALHGHAGPVTALACFGTNSDRILSGSADGTLRLWDVVAGTQLRELQHGGGVTAVAVRPDGRRLASAGMDRATRLWDGAEGKLVAELRGEKLAQERVAELERENVFWTNEMTFQDWARKSAETNQTAQTDRVTKAVKAGEAATSELLERQKQLAEARDAKTSAEQAVAEAKAGLARTPPASVSAGNPTGEARSSLPKAATTSGPGAEAGSDEPALDSGELAKRATEKLTAASKKVSDAETALKTAEQKSSNAQTELELARNALDEARKAVSRAGEAAEKVIRSQHEAQAALKYARLEVAQHDLPPRAVSFSPDNETLATTGDDRLAHLWSANDGTPSGTLRGHTDSIIAATFTSEGTLITAGSDQRIELWDPGAPWILARTLGNGDPESPLADRINALRFSPDGTRLAAGGGEPTRGGEITLWNPATGQLLRSYTNVHSDAVFALDFDREGSRLATAAADRFAKVLDLDTGAVVRPLEGHTHHVLGVAWTRDGRTLATAGADNLVKIWDFPGGERKKNVTGFDKEVTSIRFVGNTDQVLTTSGDGKVRLLKPDGSEVRSFPGATDYVYAAAATPDGRLVIAGGQDGVLRVWNGSDGQLITTFAPPPGN